MLHNKVNLRLGKVNSRRRRHSQASLERSTTKLTICCTEQDEFDCSLLEGLYDCGCSEDPDEAKKDGQSAKAAPKLDKNTGEELVPGGARA